MSACRALRGNALLRAGSVARPIASFESRRTFTATPPVMSSFYRKWMEPKGPSVVTQIPGPKAQAAIADLDAVFDTRSLNMLTDYSRSVGNYIADPDGNMLLDV